MPASIVAGFDDAREKRDFRRQTILLNIAFWLFIYVLFSLRAPLAERMPADEVAVRRVLTVTFGALSTYGLTYLLRTASQTAFWPRIMLGVLLAFGGSVLHTFAHIAIYYELFAATDIERLRNPFSAANFAVGTLDWLPCYAAAIAAYLALLYSHEYRSNERRLAEMRAFADEARLRILRNQINPHFLFNTLNSISALILDRRTEEADQMVQGLSDFYRATLVTDPHEEIPLAEEIGIQRMYLAIEETRFADRMSAEVVMPPELADCLVPALILQPLVENAVRHGVALQEQRCAVCIRAREAGGHLALTVANDQPESRAAGGLGVGLANVRQRLRAHYGGEGALIAGAEGKEWVAEITLPLRRR